MRQEIIIDLEGDVAVDVLSRDIKEVCSTAVAQAGGLGTILSDEITGPECDTVHEGISDSDSSL